METGALDDLQKARYFGESPARQLGCFYLFGRPYFIHNLAEVPCKFGQFQVLPETYELFAS